MCIYVYTYTHIYTYACVCKVNNLEDVEIFIYIIKFSFLIS